MAILAVIFVVAGVGVFGLFGRFHFDFHDETSGVPKPMTTSSQSKKISFGMREEICGLNHVYVNINVSEISAVKSSSVQAAIRPARHDVFQKPWSQRYRQVNMSIRYRSKAEVRLLLEAT